MKTAAWRKWKRDAAALIEHLRAGSSVQYRPLGHSMEPKIRSGELVTIEPPNLADIEMGDIVFVSVGGAEYVHFVLAIDRTRPDLFKIGNAKGRVNGWVAPDAVHGKVTRISP